MGFVYVLLFGSEWEDAIIFLTEEEAIQQSIKYPENRVEIFEQTDKVPGFYPTYNYYENGILIQKT